MSTEAEGWLRRSDYAQRLDYAEWGDDPERLTLLAESRSVQVRCRVAANYDTPTQDWERLLYDESRQVRNIASRCALHGDPARCEALLLHPEPRLRELAARHGQLDRPMMRRLAADPEPRVRGKLARREDLPAELVQQLSTDELEVRRELAGNSSLPTQLLQIWSTDDDPTVARRARVSLHTAQGKWLEVRLRTTPRCNGRLQREIDAELRRRGWEPSWRALRGSSRECRWVLRVHTGSRRGSRALLQWLQQRPAPTRLLRARIGREAVAL